MKINVRKVTILSLILCMNLLLSLPCSAADDHLWRNESPLTQFLARYYQVDPIVVISLGQRMTYPDDVSVAIFLAKMADRNPLDLLEPRLKKKSWESIAELLKIDPSGIFTPLSPKDNVPEAFRHAYQEYQKHLKNPSYKMVLYDKEYRNLVQLKLMVDAFKSLPLSVMQNIDSGKTFTTLIIEQVRGSEEPSGDQ
ncbi:MAG: hypothetical protein AB9903_19665 [Vulcanimicrobiota bacterium]